MKKRDSAWKGTLLAARDHIIAQGEVVYAYNLLQDKFFNVFLLGVALERPDEFGAAIRFYDHALKMWHVVQSDNQQRKLALAAISSIPSSLNLKSGVQRLEWARIKADKLAEYRNMVAHNAIMFRGVQKGKHIIGIPSFGGNSTRPSHRARLSAIKSLRFWQAVRTDLLNLSDYVEFVVRHIDGLDYKQRNREMIGMKKTWPGRPRLRSLRLIRTVEASQPKAVAGSRRVRRRALPSKS